MGTVLSLKSSAKTLINMIDAPKYTICAVCGDPIEEGEGMVSVGSSHGVVCSLACCRELTEYLQALGERDGAVQHEDQPGLRPLEPTTRRTRIMTTEKKDSFTITEAQVKATGVTETQAKNYMKGDEIDWPQAFAQYMLDADQQPEFDKLGNLRFGGNLISPGGDIALDDKRAKAKDNARIMTIASAPVIFVPDAPTNPTTSGKDQPKKSTTEIDRIRKHHEKLKAALDKVAGERAWWCTTLAYPAMKAILVNFANAAEEMKEELVNAIKPDEIKTFQANIKARRSLLKTLQANATVEIAEVATKELKDFERANALFLEPEPEKKTLSKAKSAGKKKEGAKA